MGVVYEATQLALGRRVAVKVISPQLADDPEFRERFIREARVAASVHHPNIVDVYDTGEQDDVLYLTMRYVDGTDLRTVLRGGTVLEPARAVAITEQVAAALDAAHTAGLIHRDVTPSNILLSGEGSARAGGAHGLRPRQAPRHGRRDAQRRLARHARVRRAGGAARRRGRRARRRVRARVRPAPDAHRAGPVRPRERRGDDHRAPARPAARAVRDRGRRPRVRRRRRARAREGPGRPLPDRRRARRRRARRAHRRAGRRRRARAAARLGRAVDRRDRRAGRGGDRDRRRPHARDARAPRARAGGSRRSAAARPGRAARAPRCSPRSRCSPAPRSASRPTARWIPTTSSSVRRAPRDPARARDRRARSRTRRAPTRRRCRRAGRCLINDADRGEFFESRWRAPAPDRALLVITYRPDSGASPEAIAEAARASLADGPHLQRGRVRRDRPERRRGLALGVRRRRPGPRDVVPQPVPARASPIYAATKPSELLRWAPTFRAVTASVRPICS